jgi:hypothetical protein
MHRGPPLTSSLRKIQWARSEAQRPLGVYYHFNNVNRTMMMVNEEMFGEDELLDDEDGEDEKGDDSDEE